MVSIFCYPAVPDSIPVLITGWVITFSEFSIFLFEGNAASSYRDI